jgi:type I restriction enzyme S subunit
MLSELPEEWLIKPLGEVAKIATGKTPSTKQDEFWDGDIPFITPSDLDSSLYVERTERALTVSGAAKSKLIPAGSLMFTCIASIGKAAINKTECVTNQQINACTFGSQEQTLFYHYQLQHRLNELMAMAGQTAVAIINKSMFSAFNVAVPPLNEQHRIAEILSSVDASIQATLALIEQAERVKRGLMEQLLTGGLGSEAIERGEVPEGWRTSQLKDLCEIAGEYGANASKEEFNSSLPRYLRITDIKEDGTLDDGVKVSLSIEKAAGYELKHGDVLIARSGATVGKSYVYQQKEGWCVFAGYLLRFRLNSQVASHRWLRHVLRTSWYWDWIRDSQRAGAQPNINAKEYGCMNLLVPPLEIQLSIAERLDSLDEVVSNNRQVIAQHERVKSGLMNDLLTGKVRTV